MNNASGTQMILKVIFKFHKNMSDVSLQEDELKSQRIVFKNKSGVGRRAHK